MDDDGLLYLALRMHHLDFALQNDEEREVVLALVEEDGTRGQRQLRAGPREPRDLPVVEDGPELSRTFVHVAQGRNDARHRCSPALDALSLGQELVVGVAVRPGFTQLAGRDDGVMRVLRVRAGVAVGRSIAATDV